MNRIRRYNESHIESFSKQEKEIIMEIFKDFVEEYDISQFSDFVEEYGHIDATDMIKGLPTYFIINSSFSYEDKSYTSINVHFQIYNKKDYNKIIEGLKLLSSGIKDYMNQDCCMIRVPPPIRVIPDGIKSRVEFFITDAEAIKLIRQGHFNKWNTLIEI